MNRREFMKLSAMAIAAPSFGKATTPDNTPTSNQPSKPPQQSSIFRVKPHIQLFSENTVEIVWITNVNATGYVTWSQDNWKTFTRAWNEEDGLLSANTNIHRALITDFNPKKPYEQNM